MPENATETQNGNENEAKTVVLDDILECTIIQNEPWPIDSSTTFEGRTSQVILQMWFDGCTVRDLVNYAAKDRKILYQNTVQRPKSGTYKPKQKIDVFNGPKPSKRGKALTFKDMAQVGLDNMPPDERDAMIEAYLKNKPQANNTGA